MIDRPAPITCKLSYLDVSPEIRKHRCMGVLRLAAIIGAGLIVLPSTPRPVAAQGDSAGAFELEEAIIADVHAAFEAGELSCRQLVASYLDRIQAYEDRGPAINAITAINSMALEQADALDREWERSGPRSALHCVPVLLKDNINTADMATTSGSALLRGAVPTEDATLVQRLRDAGALILGKASMGELATGSYSTHDGQQRNPYHSGRETLGSSSGSAAAVAANFTAVAVGTDTYTSVRSPAAANGIVGIRPTTGLISRRGVAPRKWNVDTAGPMARTVTDAAVLLNALAAPDPADAMSLDVHSQYPVDRKTETGYADFTRHLERGALEGARIGVVREFFGGDPEIDALAETALAEMEGLGAELVEASFEPEFFDRNVRDAIANFEALLRSPFREDWEAYLREYFGPGVPKTVAEWVEIYETELMDSRFPPSTDGPFDALVELRASLEQSSDDPEYRDLLENVLPYITNEVLAVFERYDVDAFVFPYISAFAAPIANPVETVEDPSYVAASAGASPSSLGGYNDGGFPMIVVPMGFGAQGLPAGITFMGRPYTEGTLLGFAYDYEQATKERRPSPLVPPL